MKRHEDHSDHCYKPWSECQIDGHCHVGNAPDKPRRWTLHDAETPGYTDVCVEGHGYCGPCFQERVHGVKTTRLPVVEAAAYDQVIEALKAVQVRSPSRPA